jgi:hypothetical protein
MTRPLEIRQPFDVLRAASKNTADSVSSAVHSALNEGLRLFLIEHEALDDSSTAAGLLAGPYHVSLSTVIWETAILAADLIPLFIAKHEMASFETASKVLTWLNKLRSSVVRMNIEKGHLCVYRAIIASTDNSLAQNGVDKVDRLLSAMPCRFGLDAELDCQFRRQWQCVITPKDIDHAVHAMVSKGILEPTDDFWRAK